MITPEGNDMNNRDCIAQPYAKSIAALNDGQGGEYCLLRFGDDNCENLDNFENVKLEEGGGDQCINLVDGLYGSYSWIKTSGLSVSDRLAFLGIRHGEMGLIIPVSHAPFEVGLAHLYLAQVCP
jgi:hypothetical protein